MSGLSGANSGQTSSTVNSADRTGTRIPVPPPQTVNRWKPAWAIQASIALHAAAVVVLVARPHLWPWVLATLIADHLVLTAAGLWPRSKLLGPNWTRLPASVAAAGAIAITIDDGPDPVITPRVLDLLDQHQVR